MELYLHNNRDSINVISMNYFNTIIANSMENFKLEEVGFDEYGLFSPPSLEEKIYFDDTMPPIYDDYNDEYDIFSPPTIEEIYCDYDMPPIYDDYNDSYDSFTPTITNDNDYTYVESNNTFMLVGNENMIYVIVILLSLFMMLLKVIMRERKIWLCEFLCY